MNRDILSALGMHKELAAIDKGICPTCDGPVTEFKDAISRKEFTISGMCQACQDSVFDAPEEPESELYESESL
jgi:hypothetical protein